MTVTTRNDVCSSAPRQAVPQLQVPVAVNLLFIYNIHHILQYCFNSLLKSQWLSQTFYSFPKAQEEQTGAVLKQKRCSAMPQINFG